MGKPTLTRSTRLATGAALAVLTFVATACPAQVDPAAAKARPDRQGPMADDKDPRVTKDGEDLYPTQTLEAAAERSRPTGADDGLGSGRPDETNGVCRLFAPNLPRPECCNGEFGFDAESTRSTCGLELYLGESFQESCGYYFHVEGQEPARSYVRMRFVEAASPKAAADNHDAALQGRIPGFASAPIPGIPGAYWSSYEGVHWAFLPGWDKVRQLTWREDVCKPDVMVEEIRRIVAATPPPKGAARSALVPRRRT